MDYHGQFRRAATELDVPENESARFADLIRFRIRAAAGSEGVSAGRFGGLPHLPAGTPWPSVRPGMPLAFMASLDCAELPRIAGLALPEAGSLLFFLAAEAAVESCSIDEEQPFARVVYVPAGNETVAAEPPDAEYDDGPLVSDEYDLYANMEVDMPDWLNNIPQWQSPFQKSLIENLPHFKELEALRERLWPGRNPYLDDDAVVVGGYSNSAQDSPETHLARRDSASRFPPGPERRSHADDAEHRVMREWVPLAQFAVPHLDFVTGRFLIRHDDLAAGRFDKALSFCEFTE